MRVLYPSRIGIWRCRFLLRVEIPKTLEENPRAMAGTSNELNPHSAMGRIEPGPHW